MRCIYHLLLGRKQIVRLNGRMSSPIDITSGVPQGSILSPLLFNVYLDPLLRLPFKSYVPAYADDFKVINSDCMDLQKDLDRILSWSIENFLEINVSKCEAIHFGNHNLLMDYNLSGILLPVVDTIRDLGLIVDSDLKFRPHVESVKTRSLRLIGFLFKTFHSKLPLLYIRFYFCYIIPIIDY